MFKNVLKVHTSELLHHVQQIIFRILIFQNYQLRKLASGNIAFQQYTNFKFLKMNMLNFQKLWSP